MSLEKPFVFGGVFSTDKAKGASDRRERDRLLCEEVINSCIDNIRLSSGLLCEELEDILKMR